MPAQANLAPGDYTISAVGYDLAGNDNWETFKAASGESWETFKVGLESTWEELEGAFKKLKN